MTIIEQAVHLLQSGELVAFPTETVYGLGADASNPAAIAKLYAAKGRPTNHPVIVHLADSNQLSDWASSVPDNAFKLAEKFWPGPVTLILPSKISAAYLLPTTTAGSKPRSILKLALVITPAGTPLTKTLPETPTVSPVVEAAVAVAKCCEAPVCIIPLPMNVKSTVQNPDAGS